MTQADFNKLKALGVKTVIVKATEGTTYVNGSAVSQAQMANKAGLNVDFYHYSTFSTATAAKSEATNLAKFLVNNKVSTKVLLFADMEDSQSESVNAEANLNAFWTVLNSYGYTNHAVYTSTTYLYRDAVIRTVGTSRVWRAQYPYTPSANNLWNKSDAAWQFSSTALLPSGSDYTGYLDVSISYTGLTENSAGTSTFVTTSTGNTNTGSTSTGNTSSNTNKTTTQNVSGWYTFTANTSIKSSASDSAKTVGTYSKGNRVYYNAKITTNGETWLRYLSYSGAEHYVKIASATTTTKPSTSTSKTTIVSGTYKFTGTTAIKSSASDSASTVGNYYKGNTVNYNAKITVNGETWLRYLSYSGAQHYVKISSSSTSTTTKPSTSTSTTTAATGTYTFTSATAIKGSASDSASTLGTYYKGNTVNYNAKVTVNGETWLRYLSYSGAQHYVKVSGSSTTASTSSNSTATAATGRYTFKTTTNIRTGASLSSSITGQYYAGESVYYVGKISSDGYQWLKYISNSGAYHYVAVIG